MDAAAEHLGAVVAAGPVAVVETAETDDAAHVPGIGAAERPVLDTDSDLLDTLADVVVAAAADVDTSAADAAAAVVPFDLAS